MAVTGWQQKYQACLEDGEQEDVFYPYPDVDDAVQSAPAAAEVPLSCKMRTDDMPWQYLTISTQYLTISRLQCGCSASAASVSRSEH